MTPTELEQALANFTGTEHYYRWNLLYPNFLLTDGAKFLAEEAGAFWLMDLFASYFNAFRAEGFAVLKLATDLEAHTAEARIEGGNDNLLASQSIEYSDFPLPQITLFAAPSGHENRWVILLPSEY